MAETSSIAYRLLDSEALKLWETEGVYHGAELDKNDGFIHLSSASEAKRTTELYFKGAKDLLLAELDLTKIDGVKWEAVESRDGALFPHVYDHAIPHAAILRTVAIPMNDDGSHAFPEL